MTLRADMRSVRPIDKPTSFRIVSADEARKVTGLDLAQLRALPTVQPLIRVFADGRREQAFRLPNELLEGAETS
jgi:hypothetical protein